MPFSYRTWISIITALGLACTGLHAADIQPTTVDGLALRGTSTRAISVAVRDQQGRLKPDAQPGIGVLRTAPWSPADPVRDGAREFEVLLTVASLLRDYPLTGLVSIGNRQGQLLPEAEHALKRSTLMGIPVVKVAAAQGYASADPENLFIEAGSLSEAAAKDLLARCILRFGNLPPSADPAHPTQKEVAAIRERLIAYQIVFSSADSANQITAR